MEDAEVVESVQRGVCSGMYHRGRYSPGANVTHHSHKIPRPVSERVTRFCQAAQRLLRITVSPLLIGRGSSAHSIVTLLKFTGMPAHIMDRACRKRENEDAVRLNFRTNQVCRQHLPI